mmetsp:Transcript_16334/g.41636  ORF Transcript_16334/g.41636 Transcript_16334/m.41636 type:complete len:270 (+) Transcript_16334:68-877(+)
MTQSRYKPLNDIGLISISSASQPPPPPTRATLTAPAASNAIAMSCLRLCASSSADAAAHAAPTVEPWITPTATPTSASSRVPRPPAAAEAAAARGGAKISGTFFPRCEARSAAYDAKGMESETSTQPAIGGMLAIVGAPLIASRLASIATALAARPNATITAARGISCAFTASPTLRCRRFATSSSSASVVRPSMLTPASAPGCMLLSSGSAQQCATTPHARTCLSRPMGKAMDHGAPCSVPSASSPSAEARACAAFTPSFASSSVGFS